MLLDPTRGATTRDFAALDFSSGDINSKLLQKYLREEWPLDFAKSGGTFIIDGYEMSEGSEILLNALYGLGRDHCSLPMFIDAMAISKEVAERRSIKVHGESYSYYQFMVHECNCLVVRNWSDLHSDYAQDLLSGVISARLGRQPLTILIQTGKHTSKYEFLYAGYNRALVNDRKLSWGDVVHG